MKSIKLSFTRAATGKTGLSTFWLMVFALIILDDADQREKKRRKKQREKRDRQVTKPSRKSPSGPKPF